MRRDGDPTRIGDALGALVERDGWRERLAVGRLKAQWAAVVGPQIAAHCEPVKLADGTLLVRAESGAWTTELTLLSRRLATLIDARLGGGMVADLKVIPGLEQRRASDGR